jgi:hypothetical protein
MMNSIDASIETIRPPADLINAPLVSDALPSAASNPPYMAPNTDYLQQHRHGRELLWNHFWESLNAGAKILFFAVVTPMMLARWGRDQFGVFAVANSCVALMAFVDLGLRMLTRVALTNPSLDASAKVRVHSRNFAAFLVASGTTFALVALLASAGCWHRWLHLPPAGDLVITTTVALTATLMSLQLLLERIAAAHRLSLIKSALFTGNLIAFFTVVAFLASGAGVVSVTTTYFAALALPLFFLLPFAQLRANEFTGAITNLRLRDLAEAIGSGGWINLITISWIFQGYGLVLLISWVAGPVCRRNFLSLPETIRSPECSWRQHERADHCSHRRRSGGTRSIPQFRHRIQKYHRALSRRRSRLRVFLRRPFPHLAAPRTGTSQWLMCRASWFFVRSYSDGEQCEPWIG